MDHLLLPLVCNCLKMLDRFNLRFCWNTNSSRTPAQHSRTACQAFISLQPSTLLPGQLVASPFSLLANKCLDFIFCTTIKTWEVQAIFSTRLLLKVHKIGHHMGDISHGLSDIPLTQRCCQLQAYSASKLGRFGFPKRVSSVA